MVEAAAERGAQHAVEGALEDLEVPSTTSVANAVAHCLRKSKLNVTRQLTERQEEMQKALRDSNATLKGELQAQRGQIETLQGQVATLQQEKGEAHDENRKQVH